MDQTSLKQPLGTTVQGFNVLAIGYTLAIGELYFTVQYFLSLTVLWVLCKKLVAYFSHSWEVEEGACYCPKGAQPTRTPTWVPTKMGIPTSYGPAIGRVLSSDQKARHLPGKTLKALKWLTPQDQQDFTDVLSGEQYGSISSVKPGLHLFETMMAVQEDNTYLTRLIKSKILHYLKEK